MSVSIRVLTGQQVEDSLDLPAVMAAVRDAYVAVATGDGELSPKYHWELSCGRAGAFASYVRSEGALAIKIGQTRQANSERGLPRGLNQVIVHEPETGLPVAFMDGTSITARRTGAAAAVGADALARPTSSVAALFGPGVAGRASLLALQTCFDLERVLVVGRSQGAYGKFIDELQPLMKAQLSECDPETAARSAHIIITATASTTPILRHSWLRPGTHISAIGADWIGKQELETQTLLDAYMVTDDRTQCLEIGQANVPHSQGMFGAGDIDAIIGDVLRGAARHRRDDAEITVFDSSGIGVQDAVVAKRILTRAVERNVGQIVEV